VKSTREWGRLQKWHWLHIFWSSRQITKHNKLFLISLSSVPSQCPICLICYIPCLSPVWFSLCLDPFFSSLLTVWSRSPSLHHRSFHFLSKDSISFDKRLNIKSQSGTSILFRRLLKSVLFSANSDAKLNRTSFTNIVYSRIHLLASIKKSLTSKLTFSVTKVYKVFLKHPFLTSL